MSDTEKINIWSSWYVIQGDLLSTIETRNSNGALLNLAGNNPPTVILKQPEDNGVTSCQLHLDTTKLNGYYLQGVAVTSEARNVEVYYDNGEYIGTAGRSILKNTEDLDEERCLLCCCTFELGHDIIITKLLLKLLSLRGKDQITIHKISLQLMENYGRGEEQEEMYNTSWYNPSSLVNDLPPIVQSLVNGLHHGSSSLDEMNKVIMMLRDARIAKEEKERKETEKENARIAKEEKERKETEKENKEIENDKEESEALVTDIPNSDPLTALEMKLKQFVTDQLALLEQKLETKLNDLVKRLDDLESVNNK